MNYIKFFFVVVMFHCSMQSMEVGDEETTPLLLGGHLQLQIVHDYKGVRNESERNLLDLPPKPLAHILSFLPRNAVSLNYIVRDETFKPVGRLYSSPYCPLMQEISAAHAEYIFEKYRKKDKRERGSDFHKLLKKKTMKKMSHFMKTTGYRKKQEDSPSSWSDIRLLTDLIPKETDKRDELNLNLLKEYINFYTANSQFQLNRLYYLNNGVAVESLNDFKDMRVQLFNRIINRAHTFKNYTRLVIGNDPDTTIQLSDILGRECGCINLLNCGGIGIFTLLTAFEQIHPYLGYAFIGMFSTVLFCSSTCSLYLCRKKNGKMILFPLLNKSLETLCSMQPTNAIEHV
jgi:hypothetical protein